MRDKHQYQVAILWHLNHSSGNSTDLSQGRFSPLYHALQFRGLNVQPVIYSDETLESVRSKLFQMDAVLVWVNPVERGQTRTKLNQLLREVSSMGIYVSTHPDVIDTMGSKGVLVSTRDMSWGCDTHQYNNVEQLSAEFPIRLLSSGTRVLKRHSDSSGSGVWKIELITNAKELIKENKDNQPRLPLDIPIRVRQAARGSEDEITMLAEFLQSIKSYVEKSGYIVDQAYQRRLNEGTIRCYMVRDTVGGFGHQKVNALLPVATDANASTSPQPGRRSYFPPDQPEFQNLKTRMETEWLDALLETLNLSVDQLPVLWDADFLFGPGSIHQRDAYVLCEINTSSVHPFPDSALDLIADDVFSRLSSNTK